MNILRTNREAALSLLCAIVCYANQCGVPLSLPSIAAYRKTNKRMDEVPILDAITKVHVRRAIGALADPDETA